VLRTVDGAIQNAQTGMSVLLTALEPFLAESASKYVGSAICAPVLCYEVAHESGAVHHRELSLRH